MNVFCPFIKDKCKEDECVMYRYEKCSIISLVERLSIYSEKGDVESGPIRRTRGKITGTEVLDEIKSSTPEKLAEQLISFAKDKFPGDEEIELYSVSELFWPIKFGISKFDAPPDIKLKIEQTERIAGNLLDKEQERIEKERIEEEKGKLPSWVILCVDWAISKGLKTVTKTDIKAFLAEKNIEILPQTLNLLHAKVNIELKSKR